MFGFGKVTCSAKAIKNVSAMMDQQMQVTRNIMAMVESMCEPEEPLTMEQKLLNLIPDAQKKDAEKLLNNMKFKKVKSVLLTEETIDRSVPDQDFSVVPKKSLRQKKTEVTSLFDALPSADQIEKNITRILKERLPSFVIDDKEITCMQILTAFRDFVVFVEPFVHDANNQQMVMDYFLEKMEKFTTQGDPNYEITDFDLVEIVTLCGLGELLMKGNEKMWDNYYKLLNNFIEEYASGRNVRIKVYTHDEYAKNPNIDYNNPPLVDVDEVTQVTTPAPSVQPAPVVTPTPVVHPTMEIKVEEEPVKTTNSMVPPKVKKLVTEEDCNI